MSTKRGVIALDIGTTGVKAMLITLQGEVVSSGYCEYSSTYPQPGYVEQSAKEILNKTYEACAKMMRETDGSEPICFVLSSQRSTFALTDAQGEIMNDRWYNWQDQRSSNEMDQLTADWDTAAIYAETGMPVAAPFAIYKIAWLQKHSPKLLEQCSKVVHLGDYIAWRLGDGKLCAEITNASVLGLVDVKTRCWHKKVLSYLHLDENKLPPLVEPSTIIGKISADTAKKTGIPQGLPIVAGSGDQQCAAIGAGVAQDGDASLTLGTSGFLVAGVQNLNFTNLGNLMAPISPAENMFELEANQLGGANGFRWVRDLLVDRYQDADAYDRMNAAIKTIPAGAEGLLFIPHLTGSGYPQWNSLARGSFIGLRPNHTRAHFMRAVMEGIALESKDMYRAMQNTGVRIKHLTVTGGAMKSDVWRQIIADVFEVPVYVLQVSDATAVGAAIVGAVAVGSFASTKEAVEEMVHIKSVIEPNSKRQQAYRALSDAYRLAVQQLNAGELYQILSHF